MKHHLVFTIAVFFYCHSAFAQSGTLDISFGASGIVTTTFNGKKINATGIAVQPDGKIVVAAQSGSFSDGDIIIFRYNADGSTDNSFNGNGYVLTNIENDNASDIKLQADGKIVVAGYTNKGDSSIAILLRYNTDGTPDKSFGTTGVVKARRESKTIFYGLTIQPDGKIVAAGAVVRSFTDYRTLLFKVNSDGTPDDRFGSKGMVLTNKSFEPGRALAVVTRKDKTLLTAGYNLKGANYNFELYDFNEYGLTSWSAMNKEGRVNINVKDNFSQANSISVQEDGKILMGGTAGENAKGDFAIIRLTELGKPDKGFGSGGKVITDVSKNSGEDNLSAILLQNDGKILAVGGSDSGKRDGTIVMSDAVIVRYNTDGSLDNSFGTGGVSKYLASENTYYYINSMALQTDGKIIIAGSVRNKSGSIEIILFRYNN